MKINWTKIHAGITTALGIAVVVLTALSTQLSGQLQEYDEKLLRLVEAVEKIDKDIPDSLDSAVCLDYQPAKQCACDDVSPITNECDPGGFFDTARALQGQRINPDNHLETMALDAEDTRPPIVEFVEPVFDPEIVDHLNANLHWVTGQQVAQAIADSPWSHEHEIPEDVGFWALDDDLLNENILRITTKDIAYTLCDEHNSQRGKGCFVCRNYKTEFLSQYARLTGSDSAGGVLDLQGHHAYNATISVKMVDGEVSQMLYRIWEPQCSCEVKEPNLARHYSGTGIATIGS